MCVSQRRTTRGRATHTKSEVQLPPLQGRHSEPRSHTTPEPAGSEALLQLAPTGTASRLGVSQRNYINHVSGVPVTTLTDSSAEQGWMGGAVGASACARGERAQNNRKGRTF